MRTVTPEALDAAEQYLLRAGRLIDRLRFAFLFREGSPTAVRRALRAYGNDDGGFGNALEPDLRGAGSQPEPVEVALHVLDESTTDAEPFDGPLVQAAGDFLLRVSAPDGGVPFVLPSVRSAPAAPWWQTPDDPPGHLIPTGPVAALLYKHRVAHAFVEPATRFCWERIDTLTETSPYEARAILPFLDHVPDRARATAAFDRLAPLIALHVERDPHAPGDVHFPLDFAPEPDGFGRQLFADDVIDVHLDTLVETQSDDGSWSFNWPAWTPVVRHEWGGFMTVARLKTLRAYGRFDA
ncbi:MAG: hypothetical protein ACRDWI_17425 [Jiangellaceae bacterium]